MNRGARTFWATLVFWLASCGGSPPPTSPAPSAPAAIRAGIQPVYFGVVDAVLDTTTVQTQAVWTNGWGPADFQTNARKQLQRAQALGAVFAVLSVDAVLIDDGIKELRLRASFADLRAGGVLSLVHVLFVCDECEQKGFTAAQMDAAATLVRRVAAEYPELSGVQLMANYGCGNAFVGWEAMDIVSCDRYDRSAAETRANLHAKAPGKKYAQIAGGVAPFLQAPEPFMDEAQADVDMVMLVYFIAHDDADVGLGTGILNGPLAKAYCGVSTSLLTHRRTIC